MSNDDSLDRYLAWYRSDPREQIAHAVHHFADFLWWLHTGNMLYARFAHEEAVAPVDGMESPWTA